MTIETFEDIVAWQKAKELYLVLYTDLVKSKESTYKDELLGATLAVSSAIAEGFDRGSQIEFRKSVMIARGSAAEVRSMLYIGLELGLVPVRKVPKYLTLTKEIARLLTSLEITLRTTNDRKQLKNHPR